MSKSTRPRSEELTEYTAHNGLRLRVGTHGGYPYCECCQCHFYEKSGNNCGVDIEIGENDAKYIAERHSHECRYSPDRKPSADQ